MQIPRGKDYDNCKSALLFHCKNNINVTSFKGGTSDLLNFTLVLYTVFERRLNKFQNYSFKGVIVKCEKECSAPKPIQSHNFDFLRKLNSSYERVLLSAPAVGSVDSCFVVVFS